MTSVTATRVHGVAKEVQVKLVFSGSKLCGSGRFSNVYSASLILPEERRVAIKNVWSPANEKVTSSAEHAEIQILSQIEHRFIANLLYFFTREADGQFLHCLVLDYMPSDMAKLRDSGIKFDVLDAKIYSFQLFSAVAYLGSKNIVHMDVKPQNIIMDHDRGLIKLVDFGNARRLESDENRGSSYQVTRFYRPPELLFGSEHFTTSIDVWSVACVCFEFLANRTLFKGRTTTDQVAMIVDVFGYPSEDDIKAMKVRRPRVARKSARGIEKFTSNSLDAIMYDVFHKSFVYDPHKRKSAEIILKLPFFDVVRMKPPLCRNNGVPVPDFSTPTSSKELQEKTAREESHSSEEEEAK